MSAEQQRLYALLPPDGFEPDIYAGDDEYEYCLDAQPTVEELFRAREPAEAKVKISVEPVVEITHLVCGAIHEPFILRASSQSWVAPDQSLSVHVGLGGGAISLDPGVVGNIRRRGRADAEETVVGPTTTVLGPTDAGRFARGDSLFFIRAFHPRKPEKIAITVLERARIVVTLVASVLLALAVHGLYGVGVIEAEEFSDKGATVEEPEKERFADIAALEEKVEALKESRPIELPEPEPEIELAIPEVAVPEPEPEPEVEPLPMPEAAAEEVTKRIEIARQGKTRAEALSATLAGVGNPDSPRDTLGKLGGIDVAAGTGAGTGVPALGSPGGGAQGMVGLETGRGGGVTTKGRDSAAKGVGKVKARKKRPVRGKVRKLKSLAKVRGSLSKAEVYAAINKHSRKIQGCYERGLIKKPSLSGKISFAWTIKSGGSASGVRVRSSTISDAAVASCIMGILRKIRFPKPKGGPVTVQFPFIFKAAAN